MARPVPPNLDNAYTGKRSCQRRADSAQRFFLDQRRVDRQVVLPAQPRRDERAGDQLELVEHHHRKQDDALLLTATTRELQRFVLKHLGKEELFQEPKTMLRKKL